MKTANTTSPKVKKVTSTQPKKRGRPVGSKKSTGGEHSYLTPGSINASKFSLSVGNAPVKTWERGPEIGEQTGSKTKKFVGVVGYKDKEFEEQVKTNAKANIVKATEEVQKHLLKQIDWDAEWDAVPDSEATVEQVKSWVKIEDINGKIKVGTKGYTKLDRLDIDLVDGVLQLKGKTPTNYWKYACVAILLSIVVTQILAVPLFNKLFDACTL